MAERNFRALYITPLATALGPVSKPFNSVNIGIVDLGFDLGGYAPVTPDDKAHPKLENNFPCYQWCYQPFRPNVYKTQLYFLDRMLKVAKSHGIDVILVDMPLREDNLKAMVPHFFDLYKSDVRKIAAGYSNTTYVDMFDPATFKFDDFTDTVHLSGYGAIKFVDRLAVKIAPVVASSVDRRDQLEHRQVAARSVAIPH